MQKTQSPLSLWLLLVVILLTLASVVIIDQVTHKAASPVIKTTIPEPGKDVNIGWKVGEQAPDFVLPTIDNDEIKLSGYRGKNVILNFWATWCGPCRYEIPVFKSLNDKLAKAGVVFLAVSTKDTMDNTVAYAKYNNLNFVIPVDERGTVSNSFNIRGIPTTYFINTEGIIISIKIGPFLSEDEVLDRLESFK